MAGIDDRIARFAGLTTVSLPLYDEMGAMAARRIIDTNPTGRTRRPRSSRTG